MKLIYISKGNIPSKYAHTMQNMKMSQALSQIVGHFELLTIGSFSSIFKKDISDIFDFYGIKKPFRIVRFPLSYKVPDTVSSFFYYLVFSIFAVGYSKLKKNAIVYTRDFVPAYLSVMLGIPTILETHTYSEDNVYFRIYMKTLKSPLLIGVVTISDVIRDRITKYGFPKEKILVWPDAVDLENFKEVDSSTDLRKRLSLPMDRFIVTYCGHLYENRGIETILEAAQKLTNTFFLFVGGWEEDVKKFREKMKHQTNIHFSGFVPNRDIPMYLAASDLLLMPYSAKCSTAGWMSPMKLFEYMASRRPIIATNLDSLKKHLKDDVNVILIPPDDTEELIRAIERMRENTALRKRLADVAYSDVQSLTWDNRAQDILKVLIPDILEVS